MAAGNLGALVVSLGLNGVEFFAGLTKAEYETRKSVQNISRNLESLKSGIQSIGAALGVGLSVGAITSWGAHVVEATEHLKNFSQETGSSVEELSRLSNIAKVSGTSFDTFRTLIDRLAAGIGGTEEKASKIGKTLKVLGVDATDPAQALQQLADKLAKFADGANKAALVKEIFGRNGVEFTSTLKAIAEQSGIAATRSQEQAEKATQLAESYRRLKVESSALSDAFLNSVVPSLSLLVGTMSDAIKISGGLASALGNLANLNPFGSAADDIKHVQGEIDKLKASLANPTFLGFKLKADQPALEAELAKMEKVLQIAKAKQIRELGIIDNPANYDARDIRARQLPAAPKPPGAGGTGLLDDPTRKILEASLAALKANTDQEKAVLENRQQFLQSVYDRGESSIQDYYADKQAAQAEDLRITSNNYLQELALIDTFIKNAKTERDKAQGEKEKVAATARQQLSNIQAAGRAQQLLDEQQRSLREYRRTLDDVNARMLELQGNTAAAAKIRFDSQNDSLRSRLSATIGSGTSTADAVEAAKIALDQLDATEKLVVSQAKLNDVMSRYSTVIGTVGVAQARIDLLSQTGAITEIDALNKKAQLAQQYLGALTKEADAAQLIADSYAAGSKQRAEALLQVAQLRLQIDQLAASSDVLAKKFNDIFASGFTTFLTDIIAGTKSVKQAFLDMGKSIEQSISKIASQNISETLFKKDGPLGGIGGKFAELFGGTKEAVSIGAADASIATLGTAAATTAGLVTATDAPLVTLAATLELATASTLLFSEAASAAAAATVASSAVKSSGDWLSALAAAVASGGSFAEGGNPPVGKISIVGERGPELFMPKQQGTIIPFPSGGRVGSTNNYVSVNVLPGATRQSADQAAAAIGMEIRRATARVM